MDCENCNQKLTIAKNMGWGHGSSLREPASQVWALEFNSQYHKKKENIFKPGCDKYKHVCMLASIWYIRDLFVLLTALFNYIIFKMNLDLLSLIWEVHI
jgi:hypothetical protein